MTKRKLFTSIACFALSASTLVACSSIDQKKTFDEYWLFNYQTTPSITDENPLVQEILTYNVTYTPSSAMDDADWTVSYLPGTYTTTLTLTQENTYVYETVLRISGSYIYGANDPVPFEDSVVTKTVFNKNALLTPISSTKEIVSTAPINNPTADRYFSKTHYKIQTTYNDNATSGETTLIRVKDDGTESQPNVNSFEIDSKYTYLDNEQLLFALRGLNQMTSPQFYVYAPFTKQVQTIQARLDTKVEGETFSFLMDGEQKDEVVVDYMPITLMIDGKNSGSPQAIKLAALITPQANEYRNVILEMRTTLAYSVGTLTYTLASADFMD